MSKTYYLTATGNGYSPDGTLPAGAVKCTKAQYQDVAHWGISSDGKSIVAVTPPAPTLAQQATAAISGTIALTSKSTSALNATYSIDPATAQDMESEILAFDTNGAFLDGNTSIEWPDTSGSLHTFTSAQFKAFVTAIGAYVGQMKSIRRTGKLPKGAKSLPGNSISIS